MDYKYLMETILNHLDEGILVVDTAANVTFYNEPATNIAGISQNEAIGKNILDIFRGLTPETSTFYKVLKYKKPIIDYVQTYANYQGRIVSTVTSTIPLLKNGDTIGALEIYRDLTQVMELSDKITLLQKELYGRNDKDKAYKSNGTVYTIDNIVGKSSEIISLKDKIRKIADSSSPVLVYGETGTGKELLVQAIHNLSKNRHDKPFIAQNCAALPDTLLESILFGTSTGSFTGAKEKPGLFELADGGTLFLDEINSMNLELQSKLLRVLQDNVVRRIGGTTTRQVDVRIMVSTNEKPMEAVETGKLRKDLYYRLNVIYLNVPTLRERKEDIPLLVEHFVRLYNKLLNKKIEGISEDASEALKSYSWNGNIRELKYTIESVMNFIEGNNIELQDLPINIVEKNKEDKIKKNESSGISSAYVDLNTAISQYEKELIKNAIKEANGNCAKAARLLNIPKQTLHNKIKKYNIAWHTIIE